MHEHPTRSSRRINIIVRKSSAQSVRRDWADPRTTACRHLADAMVDRVGNEHVAACIDRHAIRMAEAGVGPGTVSIIGIAFARKRGNHCSRTSQANTTTSTVDVAVEHLAKM
jgi:hypothetical protein